MAKRIVKKEFEFEGEKVEWIFTGKILSSTPPKYLHKCSNKACKEQKYFNKAYPYEEEVTEKAKKKPAAKKSEPKKPAKKTSPKKTTAKKTTAKKK